MSTERTTAGNAMARTYARVNGNGHANGNSNGKGHANGNGHGSPNGSPGPLIPVALAKKPSHILVTGGAGFIGSHLVRKLLAHGHRVRILDSLLYGDAGIRDLIDRERIEFRRGDIRDIDVMIRALTGVDAVIHLAAIVGDPACEVDADSTYGTNFEATRTLVELCKARSVRRLVFASSCSVYGSNPELLLNEGSWLNPVSLYARTRVMSEQLVLAASDQLEVVILRLATVFGMSPRARLDLVINTMAARAVTARRIQVYGGDQWRPNVHVQDAAEAFLLAATAPADRAHGQVFNVGSEDMNRTIAEMALAVAGQIPGTLIEMMSDAPDRRDYRVSFEKIRTLLGFRRQFSIDDGVAEIVQAFASGAITDADADVYHNVRILATAHRTTESEQTGAWVPAAITA